MLIGIVAGLGAVVFSFFLDLATRLLLVDLGGYTPAGTVGDGGPADAGDFTRPWAIPLVVAAGGLLAGILVFGFAPRPKDTARTRSIEGAQARVCGRGSRSSRRWRPHHRLRRIGRAGRPHGTDLGRPSVISSVTGYGIYGAITGNFGPIFGYNSEAAPAGAGQVAMIALVGVACGLLGRLCIATFYGLTRFFRRTPLPCMTRPALAGLAVGRSACWYPGCSAPGTACCRRRSTGRTCWT